MISPEVTRVGYVLKVYPRYSETFIVNEILAHEAAGLSVEIYSLRSPTDSYFQDLISRVRAPVIYVPSERPKAEEFWVALTRTGQDLPALWADLAGMQGEEASDIYQAVLLANLARRRGIQHLHAHFASVATTVTRLAARFAGLPYTFTAHAKDIFHESVQPHVLERKIADAAATVTVSDYNVAHLRRTFGPAAARVQRIYNGLDLARFPYEQPYERAPLIMFVGRLVEKKGLPDLVDACAILARRRCFTCEIIGTGEIEAELRAQIDRLNLQGIVALSGPLPQSEVIRRVHNAAALAAPCVVGTDGNADGLPTVLLEAMALGTPCVATDVTGIPEVLRDDQTGLMVRQHDPSMLADALERLLDDSALRLRLACNARRLIEAEFDIHRNAARQRAVFESASRETGAPMYG